MYVVTNNIEITPENVQSWITYFKGSILPIYENLDTYYQGVDKLNKVETELDKYNKRQLNIIHSNLAKMIVTNACGYFMGKPVTYAFDGFKDEKNYKQLLWQNDEQAENQSLAKMQSIYGIAYELMGVDINKQLYIKALSPLNTFFVVDNSILKRKICAITFWTSNLSDNTQETRGFIYTPTEIIPFSGSNSYTLGVVELNPFKPCIPVFEFKNNDEEQGDFASVTELLSAYSKLISTSFDDVDSIANSILALVNARISKDESKELKKSRVIELMGDNADIKYVSKNISKEYVEYLRNALREDIFSITNVPDLTDEKFAGNQSGVALSYKLIGFENLRLIKKNYFERGLFERLKCYMNFKKLLPVAEDVKEGSVTITFQVNLPTNIDKDSQYADLYNKGVISLKTCLEHLEAVDDVDEEEKRIQEEKPNIEDLDGQTGTETGHQGQ